jgi:hypothetical protein
MRFNRKVTITYKRIATYQEEELVDCRDKIKNGG